MNPGDRVVVTDGAWSGYHGVIVADMSGRPLWRVQLDADAGLIVVRMDWLVAE